MSDNWTLLHARLHQTLRQRQLLPRQERILVALSGGQDSLCLTKLLLDLQPKWEWTVAIAHCDHRWFSDAGIAQHVEQIARSWHLPFYLKVADALKETEAAARQWRYQALKEIAREEGFPFVVTGHTQSDRAETLLYNLIRGAGADGLSSLTWYRSLTPTIKLVRPLLDVSRQETLEFCQQLKLPIWFDAANQNLKYARNRIRKELIPYLKKFNPQVEKSLAQTTELLRADAEYLETQAEELLKQAIVPAAGSKLNRLCLRKAPITLQRRALRQFIARIIKKHPTFEQIEAIIYLINAPNKTRTSTLPGGAIAQVEGEWIVFIQISY
jgi:tRNA(Ile)-lysidine synthase